MGARSGAKLRSQLRRGDAQAASEAFEASFHRARRFHAAWSRHDVPKQTQQAEKALRGLQRELMTERQRQAQAGVAPQPPADLLAQIGALGGPEAEEEARRVFAQTWEVVDRASLEARVREVAMRAMWDSVQAQVDAGEYSGLFSLLGELQQAMGVLVAHSPRATEALSDHFDAQWIAQQAAAGVLSLENVHRLMAYVVDQIGGWQAPVDDDEMRAWATQVHDLLASSRDLALEVFISRNLIGFLKEALERVGRVYQRVLALAPRAEPTPDPADAAARSAA